MNEGEDLSPELVSALHSFREVKAALTEIDREIGVLDEQHRVLHMKRRSLQMRRQREEERSSRIWQQIWSRLPKGSGEDPGLLIEEEESIEHGRRAGKRLLELLSTGPVMDVGVLAMELYGSNTIVMRSRTTSLLYYYLRRGIVGKTASGEWYLKDDLEGLAR